MKVSESTPAVLLLQDGTLFHGKALGKIGTHGGEICFNTGMTGYQEIYTDPSYSGQVIINTTAHIGNYGVIDGLEAESDRVQIAGMVCNEFASVHSRETADGSLQDYLANEHIPASARKFTDGPGYYDFFNTGLQIDNSDYCQVYHKSKLVPGVEIMPFPWLFKPLEELLEILKVK